MADDVCPECGGTGVIDNGEGEVAAYSCEAGRRAATLMSEDNQKDEDKLDD